MSQLLYHDLTCTACGAPGLHAAGERVVCGYCGAEYAEARSFCANCRHVNRAGAEFCEQCGDPLTRACPSCRTKNWIGAEYCAHCGQPLDILEYLYQRHRQSTADWLNQARQEARVIKEHEDEAGQRRSAGLWAKEKILQDARATAADRQAARDRLTMRLIFGGIVLFGIALIVAGYIVTTW